MATNYIRTLLGWLGWGASATSEQVGVQDHSPSSSMVSGQAALSSDVALQLDTVWACIDRRATTLASLPMFVYQRSDSGHKDTARASRLWGVLHDSPNARMTPFDFWRTMVLNYDLRGNAYARIERADPGNPLSEVVALWPMPADQVQTEVLTDGSMVYAYRIGQDVMVLAEQNVLHLRNLGNGTTGLDKLSFMRAGLNEAAAQVQSASTVWGSSGKPTGVLMIDSVLKEGQRTTILERFAGMSSGNAARLYVLEAGAKYQQISISPEQQQLLESRQFSVEQICRWYDVPPVLVHHANVTTWGSGIEQLVDGFHKFTINPLAVSIEQALRKRVFTPAQRANMAAEFNMDALLRGSLKDRMALYATAVQNGLKTRNECRQLENDPPYTGGDELTVQTNLTPIQNLGAVTAPAA